LPARFDGKVALVIGGSSGIGLATVRGLLADGGRVVIAARDEARLAAVGQELLTAHQGRVAWVRGDISELGEAERFVAATVTRFGRLDILVTSSAYNYTRAIVDTTEDEIDAVIRTNARGPLLAARAASRAFGAEGGRIVTLSATAASRGRPHRSVYAATKGAVEAMSRDPNRTRQIPMGRLGRPEEVATVVLFLASDDAGWVTGQTVDATGGYGL
jgi:3-oxoacyl-[acyl-carrier protein] reductase